MNEQSSSVPVVDQVTQSGQLTPATLVKPKKSWLTRLGLVMGGVILIVVSGFATIQLLTVLKPKQPAVKAVANTAKQTAKSNDKSSEVSSTTAPLAASLPSITMTTPVVISDKTTVTASLPKDWVTTEQAIQSTSAENKAQGAVVTYGVLDMQSQYDSSADNQEASLNAMNLINAVLNGRAIDGKVTEIQKANTALATSDQKGLQMFYKWFEYSDKKKTLQRTEVAIRASAQKYIIVFYTVPRQEKSQFNELLNSMKVEGLS